MSGLPTPLLKRRIFGAFEFEEASGELRKHGVRIRIQGQPLQILSALLREPGRVVTRDELHQQLWKSSTFVDFDHGLDAAMNRLRQILMESADQPRYIETLPGRGYRFIAAVQDPEAKPLLVMPTTPSQEDTAAAAAPLPAAAAPGARPVWILAAGIFAGLAAGYVLAGRAPERSIPATVRFSIAPPPGFALEPGSSRQIFALSPDGTRLAFSAMDAGGSFHAFLRDLNALESRPVPNAAGSYHVFFAEDGRSLFLTVRGAVRRASLDGDSYQVICDAPPLMLSGALLGRDLMISARSATYLVPVAGGTPRAMKELYPWPQTLPGNQRLLYTAFDAKSGHHRAHVVELNRRGSDRDLLETDSRAAYAPSMLKPGTGYLVYVRAGNLLAQPVDPQSLRLEGEPLPVASPIYSFFPTGAADFSVSANGMVAYTRYRSKSQLAWVNRAGEVVSTVGPANINVKQGRLSPDGKKVAAPIFDVSRGRFDIWIFNTETGTARRAITGAGHVDNPVWAPDSKRLVYGTAGESPSKLFLRGLGENDPEEALPPDYFQVPSDWSRDGRFIAFTNTTFTQTRNELLGAVQLIDMADRRKVIHLIETPFHEADPAFSPDTRWLAFTSNQSGRTEVYIQSFEAGGTPRLVGERRVVSRQGAVSLRWRPDGRELYYLAADGRVYAVPITLSPTLKIGEPAALFAISTEARAAIHSIESFDVSADGQRFLVPIITSSERQEIVVIQNWEVEALRERGRRN